jgi:uncharacterized membrane protein YagU involved in acid resistance
MNSAENGIWAGALATGPMTLAMFGLQRYLPTAEKSPLPPATLTSQITQTVGVDQSLAANQRADLTMVSHFGYGIVCGLIYAFGTRRFSSSPVLKGSLFGFGVWAASYLGWIPAVGLRASAFKMPAKRNGLMILAHLVWGASLGFAENELRTSGHQMLDGHRKAPLAE